MAPPSAAHSPPRRTGSKAARPTADYSEKTLSEVAKIADGKFFRADSTQALAGIFETIDKLEKTTVQVSKYRQYHDLFGWCLSTAAGLLAVHLCLSQTAWRRLP